MRTRKLGPRMHHVRGNHDAMISDRIAANAPLSVQLPGVTLAVLDTVRPGVEHGRVTGDQLGWLDDLASESDVPVLVFGHHHPWDPSSSERNANYFGINPDDSESLCRVIDRRDADRRLLRRPHASQPRAPLRRGARRADRRDRVREGLSRSLGGIPRHEGGYAQLVRRIASPAAMAWTEQTRMMFAGLYRDYALGQQQDRCFTRSGSSACGSQ